MTATIEHSARRLASAVRFTFDFGTPQHEVTLYAHYIQSVEKSELVFKVALLDNELLPLASELIMWPYSKTTATPFAHSPAGQTNNIVRLPQLRATRAFTKAIVEPIRWIGPGVSPLDLVDDVWAVHSNSALSLGQNLTLSEIVAVSVKESLEP